MEQNQDKWKTELKLKQLQKSLRLAFEETEDKTRMRKKGIERFVVSLTSRKMSKNSSLEGHEKGECYYKRSKKQTKQEES